jgi:hypothetical protein
MNALIATAGQVIVRLCKLHSVSNEGQFMVQTLLDLIVSGPDTHFQSFALSAKNAIHLFAHVILSAILYGIQPIDFVFLHDTVSVVIPISRFLSIC